MMSEIEQAAAFFKDLQTRIAAALGTIDGAPFAARDWRSALGEGRTMLREDGEVIERGGVNFSLVQGGSLPAAASARRPELAGRPFAAAGVSLVIHPRNPFAPTVHLNARFFQAGDAWWFGGGMDLTPYYGFADDCRHFHRACKATLDEFGAGYYPKFKKWCDDYFYLKHRNEARGIGGIFFDDFCERDFDFSFALTKRAAEGFLAAYPPILQKRKDAPYGERERDFQLYRRGRYVEFNLIWDRGTLFGLQSGGRAEAILMSMPPLAKWRYEWRPEKDSAEEKLYRDFLPPREWV